MSSDKPGIYYDPLKTPMWRVGSYGITNTYIQPTIQFKIKPQLFGKKNAFDDIHNASVKKSFEYINSNSKRQKQDYIVNINRQIVVNQLQNSLYKVRSNQYIMKNKWEDYLKIKSKNNIDNLNQQSKKDLHNCLKGMNTALNQYQQHIYNINQYLLHQTQIYQLKYNQMLNHSNNHKSINFNSFQKHIARSSSLQVGQNIFNQQKQQLQLIKQKNNYKDSPVDYKKHSFILQVPYMCRQDSKYIKQQIQAIKNNLITIQKQCIGERIKSRTDNIKNLLADIERNNTLARIIKLQKIIEELNAKLQDQQYKLQDLRIQNFQNRQQYQQQSRFFQKEILNKERQIKEITQQKVQVIHQLKVKHLHQTQQIYKQFSTFGIGGRSQSFQMPRNRGRGRIEQPEDIDVFALLNQFDDENHQQRHPNTQYYTRTIRKLQDQNRQLLQKIQQNRQKNRDDDLTLQQFIADLNRLCNLHITLMEIHNRKYYYHNKT